MKFLLKNLATVLLINFLTISFALAEPYVMGAIGDSITRAFNAKGILDKPKYSWSTGYSSSSSIMSHFKMLKLMEEEVKGYNYARTGARAYELDRQVSKVLSKNPDYVTVLMGANDVCKWPDDHAEKLNQFQNDFENALERLVTANPDIKISLAPIPDMYQLWEVGDQNGCYTKWKLLNLCQRLLGRNVSAIERQRFEKRWRDANESIEAAGSLYPDNVIFIDSVQHIQFSYDHLSRKDCFHPSIKGQNLLSKEAWDNSWFKVDE